MPALFISYRRNDQAGFAGRLANAILAILPTFLSTLIHDGWKPYRELLCKHGLCNAHHLRELTYVSEELNKPGLADDRPAGGRMSPGQ